MAAKVAAENVATSEQAAATAAGGLWGSFQGQTF